MSSVASQLARYVKAWYEWQFTWVKLIKEGATRDHTASPIQEKPKDMHTALAAVQPDSDKKSPKSSKKTERIHSIYSQAQPNLESLRKPSFSIDVLGKPAIAAPTEQAESVK